MRKPVPIRFTSSDEKEYARLVRNTKAKIARTKKKYGVDLSSKVRLPSLNDFMTKGDYEAWKDEMKSFTNVSNTRFQFKKNKHGAVASKRELNKIKRLDKRAMQMIEKKIDEQKDKPFYVNGKVVGTQEFKSLWLDKPDIGGYYKWKPFDWEDVRDTRTVKKRIKRLEKILEPGYFEKRTNKMRESFIGELRFSFNSEAEQVITMLQYLHPDDFYEIYQMFPDVFNFNQYASENSGGASDIDDLKAMQGYLEDFFQGRIDMDLKGF